MNISKKGIAELWGHEGVCLRPYLDSVGVWTIAFGATASEGINIAAMDKKEYISMEYALELFNKGIVKYVNAVNKALKVDVTQEQFDALVSVCYNIGVGGLSKSTFIKRINAKAAVGRLPQSLIDVPLLLSELDRTDPLSVYSEIPQAGFAPGSVVDAIMMWTKPKEITNRRKKEAKLFSTGIYSNGGKALLFDTNGAGKVMYAKGKTINIFDYF